MANEAVKDRIVKIWADTFEISPLGDRVSNFDTHVDEPESNMDEAACAHAEHLFSKLVVPYTQVSHINVTFMFKSGKVIEKLVRVARIVVSQVVS